MSEPRIVELRDERDPLADMALGVLEEVFPAVDRQPSGELRSVIAERRLGMQTDHSFHMLVALVDGDERPAGVIIGQYLDDVNAGIVLYLAVRREYRGRRTARLLRPRLLDVFRDDARRRGAGDLAWVIGEVRANNPWLRRLVRTRGAIPFDLEYLHPGMDPGGSERFVLYRQPIADARRELPVALVRRILYAVYRRAYRVRYPLQRRGFEYMLQQLEGRASVGVHPDFAHLLD